MATSPLWQFAPALLALAAALISAALIIALKPLLVRYALARPNARSSHVVPTPQGGGIAVIAATVVAAIPALIILSPAADQQLQVWILFAAAAFLAIVGAVDDIRTIEVAPRLIMQFIAAGLVVALLPSDLHVVPMIPIWIERALLVIAGVWFVNLTNFMDGIDWMTVTEVAAVTIGVVLLALIDALPAAPAIVALALLGAIAGFAPFNRPIAKLFLGDVGSLPIGLIVFWLMVQLAGRGHLAAALLLPLYYVADATITLLLRIARSESILQAHRGHFYQQATNRGWSVPAIVARVALTNAVLVLLAVASVWVPTAGVQIATLTAGAIAVAFLLRHLTQGTP
jgi:UDP-N-acetylmuramyl pentapeptide phosphotransferase/UDP-N-acetylglucosamine-1-phosphate transferase